MQTDDRISLLDARLANQIAAGEVVERPASVVKELVENSIDAGATRIEVDIERGGARLIRITDNGKGIHKDDLPLALTRHATSKIHTTDDLANIQSLGFRGEALASISSVSRLTLTSRTADSELAWQAVAQGRDMAVEVLPAAASPGTRLEIADLFFNTPARQKFLRTEKTEFSHIEEVFKRHALANFEIAFVLKHNHKIIKRVPACGEKKQWLKRVATICGKPFADNGVPFECNHEAMRLWGWLGHPGFHRSESDIQYVFINGRPVKDKTLNHAVRQAYDGLLPPGRMATYVIYLEVNPRQVDVNVHPTKHEVRFSEQRLVHDLLAKSIADALGELSELPRAFNQQQSRLADYPKSAVTASHSSVESGSVNEPFSSLAGEQPSRNPLRNPMPYNRSPQNQQPQNFSSHMSQAYAAPTSVTKTGEVTEPFYRPDFEQARYPTSSVSLTGSPNVLKTGQPDSNSVWSLGDNYFVTQIESAVVAVKADRLVSEFIQQLLNQKIIARRKALLFPQSLTLSSALLEDFNCHALLEQLGFELQLSSGEQIVICQFPEWLAYLDKDTVLALIPEWLSALANDNLSTTAMADLIGSAFQKVPLALVIQIIEQMPLRLDDSESLRRLAPDQVAGLFS